MKKRIKQIVLVVAALLIVAANKEAPRKLFIIGDSTASGYGTGYYPRNGWGQVLQPFFNPGQILVVNKALSGRSSRSYFSDPDGWETVLNSLGAGDYLFIQFGHNDEKDDERHTDPYSTYQEFLSIYVDSARARGAIPVLMTSVHRNSWNGNYINDTHGDYPPAVRDLAAEKEVPLIDMHRQSEILFESLGPDYTTNELFLNLPPGKWLNYVSGVNDNTHFQENGAFELCKLVAERITELDTLPAMQVLEAALVPVGRVIVMPDPWLSASITGRGVYSISDTVTLNCTGQPGHAFEAWMESDTLVAVSASFSFVLADSLRTFSATTFPVYEVTLEMTPSYKGILQGRGYYAAGEEVTIIATPKEGYRFIDWKKDETVVSTDSLYTFTMGEEDVTYLATFEAAPEGIIGKAAKDPGINVYPNPGQGVLTLEGMANGASVIRIYSMDGTLLNSYFSELSLITLDTGLPAGIYVLQIKQSGNTVSTRIVVE